MPLLDVRDLHIAIGPTEIVRGVELQMEAGEAVGIVGESGCGKSMFGLSLMGLLPSGGKVTSGSITLDGQDLTGLREKELRKIRGDQITMVMQDPFTSLNPMIRIQDQVAESLVLHRGLSWSEARRQALALLERVKLPELPESGRKFPHQLSGGQRQRVVIAIAFVTQPKLIIADEPTTALDVTLQAQILGLLQELREETGTACILISHNIGVISATCSKVHVFYAGQSVESGPTRAVLDTPQHPYTKALLAAIPRLGATQLETIGGFPPRFNAMPTGCAFEPRCSAAFDKCSVQPSLNHDGERTCRCWLAQNQLAER